MTFVINPYISGVGGGSPNLPVISGLQVDFDPNAYAGVDQADMPGSWSNGDGVFEPRGQAGTKWQAPGTTHSCNNLATAFFDGTSFGALFSAGPVIDGPVLTSFTMFCVLKAQNDGDSENAIFGALAGGAQWLIDSANKPWAYKSGGSTLGTATTALSLVAFQQIAITYDGADVTFYKDGASDGTASVAQTMTGKTQYIGNGTGGAGGAFNYWARGAIYDRVLNGGELSSMFSYLSSRYAVT